MKKCKKHEEKAKKRLKNENIRKNAIKKHFAKTISLAEKVFIEEKIVWEKCFHEKK